MSTETVGVAGARAADEAAGDEHVSENAEDPDGERPAVDSHRAVDAGLADEPEVPGLADDAITHDTGSLPPETSEQNVNR